MPEIVIVNSVKDERGELQRKVKPWLLAHLHAVGHANVNDFCFQKDKEMVRNSHIYLPLEF